MSTFPNNGSSLLTLSLLHQTLLPTTAVFGEVGPGRPESEGGTAAVAGQVGESMEVDGGEIRREISFKEIIH